VLQFDNARGRYPKMLVKIKRFCREPLLNKLHSISLVYCRMKGIVVYRRLFKQFGAGSYIKNPLLIRNAACISVGDRVSILDGARLEAVVSNKQRIPTLTIGSNTNIEQNVHIVCHSRVQIGCNVSITGHCAIVDVTHPFSDVSDPRKVGARILDQESFVEIGDGSFIGFGTVILPNVRIGTNVVIGANSVVSHHIPDYSVAAGAPAIVLKRYDFGSSRWVKVPAEIQMTDTIDS
jgi:acetyltransferase-like isoleucine patch superfamily enzyme